MVEERWFEMIANLTYVTLGAILGLGVSRLNAHRDHGMAKERIRKRLYRELVDNYKWILLDIERMKKPKEEQLMETSLTGYLKFEKSNAMRIDSISDDLPESTTLNEIVDAFKRTAETTQNVLRRLVLLNAAKKSFEDAVRDRMLDLRLLKRLSSPGTTKHLEDLLSDRPD